MKTKTKKPTNKLTNYSLFFEEIPATHYSVVHTNGDNEFTKDFRKATRPLRRHSLPKGK